MPVMAMRNEWHVKKRIGISRTLSCPMDMYEYSKSSPPTSPIITGTITKHSCMLAPMRGRDV